MHLRHFGQLIRVTEERLRRLVACLAKATSAQNIGYNSDEAGSMRGIRDVGLEVGECPGGLTT